MRIVTSRPTPDERCERLFVILFERKRESGDLRDLGPRRKSEVAFAQFSDNLANFELSLRHGARVRGNMAPFQWVQLPASSNWLVATNDRGWKVPLRTAVGGFWIALPATHSVERILAVGIAALLAIVKVPFARILALFLKINPLLFRRIMKEFQKSQPRRTNIVEALWLNALGTAPASALPSGDAIDKAKVASTVCRKVVVYSTHL